MTNTKDNKGVTACRVHDEDKGNSWLKFSRTTQHYIDGYSFVTAKQVAVMTNKPTNIVIAKRMLVVAKKWVPSHKDRELENTWSYYE